MELSSKMVTGKANAGAAARPFLISFSGIDGAGKTTQIEQLTSSLQSLGFRVLRLSFWDDIAVWSQLRSGVGERTVGLAGANVAEGPFVAKNNKHVRKWYLTAARLGLYVLDVARLHCILANQAIRNSEVVIFDRFVYDHLANVDLQLLAARVYGKALLKLTPVPDLAFVIDASPLAAFTRKPEYPLEFVHKNRNNFLCLRDLAPELIIIHEGSPEDVKSKILFHINRSRIGEHASREQNTLERDFQATPDPVVHQQSSCRARNEPTASV